VINQFTAGITLLGILLVSILFGWLVVKLAELRFPSFVTSIISFVVTKITNGSHNKGYYPQWLKYFINNIICFYTGIEKRFQVWIQDTEMVNGRNSQDRTRCPKGSLDMLNKEIPQKTHRKVL
jgi:hypothetical protein